MKKWKWIPLFMIVCLLSITGLTGCDNCAGGPPTGKVPGGEGVLGVTDYNPQTYDNVSYNEFVSGEDAVIEGQWENYGIGDPFIMRYNGMYYLYASTLDSEYGVRGWKSSDLVAWTQCQGQGLSLGYVSQDAVTEAAYAPEVYYWNGTFYMYTSPAGLGHYILTSSNPEGPFVAATGNIGHSIDGSVFIDDDESIYFLEAHSGGIRYSAMENMLTVGSSRSIGNTNIGGWTEGAYLLKREGKYFLTYTGAHVASDGYKIAYSVSDSAVANYNYGADSILALNTEGVMKGIGHSATVMGPDLDSYYLSYHILNSSGGPNRSYALDRLLFNGSQMSVSVNEKGSIKPTLPAFHAADLNDFTQSGDFYLSESATSETFSAEFNFRGDGVKNVVSYVDENNYLYVRTDLANKKIVLTQVAQGTESQIAEGTLVNDFSADVIHTVRVAHRDGKMDVYFDNMGKIYNAEVRATAGKIGYLNATDVGYTAFSNVAKGLSDQLEYKQSGAIIGSSTYDESLSFLPTAQVSTVAEGSFAGAKEIRLSTDEYATYLVNFHEAGFYGIEMVYPRTLGGTKVGVRFNGGDVLMVTLPRIDTQAEYVRALVTEMEVKAGVNELSLEALSTFRYVNFRFVKTSKVNPQFTHDLSDYVAKGADYQTLWKINENAHFVKANTRNLLYFGDDTLTDYTVSVDMKFNGGAGSASAGLILRADNYAASSHDNHTSIQGYYVSLKPGEVGIERLNYFDSNTTFGLTLRDQAVDEWFTVKVVVKQNTITVFVDGTEVLSVTDDLAYTSGKLGFYTNGASVFYRNLSIQPAA